MSASRGGVKEAVLFSQVSLADLTVNPLSSPCLTSVSDFSAYIAIDTLVGLASNVGLTATKGVAGIYMNSASLLAEAGHSLSDLLGVSPACPNRSQPMSVV